jgi:hypothetical protein
VCSSDLLSQELSQNIFTSSIFSPDPNIPITNLYSPIIDEFSIQKYDLLRIGSIKNPNPDYYTILNAYTGSVLEDGVPIENIKARLLTNYVKSQIEQWSSISVPADNSNTTMQSLYGNTRLLLENIWNSNTKKFQISGVQGIEDNVTFEIIGREVVIEPYPGLFVLPGIGEFPISVLYSIIHYKVAPAFNLNINRFFNEYNAITGANNILLLYSSNLNILESPSPITLIPQISNTSNIRYKFELDRELTPISLGNLNQNFAILRPKPDETSVIINYKKELGDVSQTILIPQDASKELKDNVGNIYQKLNVDLSNQNTQ